MTFEGVGVGGTDSVQKHAKKRYFCPLSHRAVSAIASRLE